MILPYQEIKDRCKYDDLLEPAVERSKAFGMSYGYSAAGYDVRVGGAHFVPAGGFELAATFEHFTMPNDLLGQVCDKSSWARQGLALQNTIIEPGWRGYLTLELTNHSDEGIFIPFGSPIAQIIFMRLTEPTVMPYHGKYQDQPPGPQEAILESDTDE
jgi:dCTP deaminase